jgi:hypothetical protein
MTPEERAACLALAKAEQKEFLRQHFLSVEADLRDALEILCPNAEGADTASVKELAMMVAEEALHVAGFEAGLIEAMEADCRDEIDRDAEKVDPPCEGEVLQSIARHFLEQNATTIAECERDVTLFGSACWTLDENGKLKRLDPPGMARFSGVCDPFSWHTSTCTAHQTETPEERQRKLDEARKRAQQADAQDAFAKSQSAHEAARRAINTSGVWQASGVPAQGDKWTDSVSGDEYWYYGNQWYRSDSLPLSARGRPESNAASAQPDFGAQVSDQLARQRGIDKPRNSGDMRVPTFAEKEAERARMAEHFRAKGIL